MPNWCINHTIVRGDVEKIKNLTEVIKNETGLFQSIKPCPQELNSELLHTWGGTNSELQEEMRATMKARYGYANGIDWCVGNWGTKWDVTEVYVHECTNDTIAISYDTAWSPPLYIFNALQEDGLQVESYWFEPGMGFAGYMDGDGIVETDSIHMSDDVREVISQYIDIDMWYDEDDEDEGEEK